MTEFGQVIRETPGLQALGQHGYRLGREALPLTSKVAEHELEGISKKDPDARHMALEHLRAWYREGIVNLLNEHGTSLPQIGVNQPFAHIFHEKVGRQGMVQGLERRVPEIPETPVNDPKNSVTAHFWDGYTVGWAAKIAAAEKRTPSRYEIPQSKAQFEMYDRITDGNFTDISFQETPEAAVEMPKIGENSLSSLNDRQKYEDYMRTRGLLAGGMQKWLRGKSIIPKKGIIDLLLSLNPEARRAVGDIVNTRQTSIQLGQEQDDKIRIFANRLLSSAVKSSIGGGK